MSELDAAPDAKQLAALVFELASQLHVERAQRLALQAALEKAGLLDRAALEAVATDAGLLRASREQLEESVAKLLAVLAEDTDPRQPLREILTSRKTQGVES